MPMMSTNTNVSDKPDDKPRALSRDWIGVTSMEMSAAMKKAFSVSAMARIPATTIMMLAVMMSKRVVWEKPDVVNMGGLRLASGDGTAVRQQSIVTEAGVNYEH